MAKKSSVTDSDLEKMGLVEVSPNVFKRVGNVENRDKISSTRHKISKNRNKVESDRKRIDLFIESIKQELGLIVVPELKFHHERKWRFDYAIPDHKIAIEVEGGIWMKGGGAHSRPKNILRDMAKYNEATALGWRLIRVTPQQLNKRYTINQIKKLLK